ncbi:MAG: hypothetical protein VXZ72_03920 [Chlamydiota bacterium]|nr:hypothetical protein [Chlamydiota bacterium]
MSNNEKIKKAREATLAHLNKPEQKEDPQPAFKISERSKQALESIAAQMEQTSAAEPTPLKESSKVDDYSTMDSAFTEMALPPDIAVASVGKRKEIEERIEPISIDDLFVSGELQQVVPIRPGRLEVVFKTLKGAEDLYIKNRLKEVRNDVVRYAEDRFVYMLLCAHIHSFNGKVFTPFLKEGGIDELSFDRRFEELCNIPNILIEEIWVHYRWFEERVKDALREDNLKSG